MKVDVLTAEKADIKKWHWWSSWIDIAIMGYGYDGYLVQMKVSRTNAKKFKLRNLSGIGSAKVEAHQVGNLIQMEGSSE